jgi:flagellar FliL protein
LDELTASSQNPERPSNRRKARQKRRQETADPDRRAGRAAFSRRRALFPDILPHALGMDKREEKVAGAAPAVLPSYVDVHEIVANLNSNTRNPIYVKLAARIEVPKPEDVERVKAALPRLQDMMQAYLREMRPEQLRGSAGTYRLREELLARANAVVAPAKVSDALFIHLLVQ